MSVNERGPDAVRARLIQAATELLEERSARQISGRDIARRADVNYGLIHRYFGSKEAVIEAAFDDYGVQSVAQLLDGGIKEPVPIDTSDNARRFRTLGHLALDEDLEELKHEYPGMRRFLELRAERTGRPLDDPDLHAEVAVISVLQFGWAIFEDYIMRALDPYDPDLDALRQRVAALSEHVDSHEP